MHAADAAHVAAALRPDVRPEYEKHHPAKGIPGAPGYRELYPGGNYIDLFPIPALVFG